MYVLVYRAVRADRKRLLFIYRVQTLSEFFFYSFFLPTGHGYPFPERLLLLLQATAAREPIPAPGGHRQGRQTEGRETSGIEPETSRSTG